MIIQALEKSLQRKVLIFLECTEIPAFPVRPVLEGIDYRTAVCLLLHYLHGV